MYDNEWRSGAPRKSQPAISPFVQRIGILLLAFVLLLPIARLIDRGDRQVVKATALPGATVSGVSESSTPSPVTTLPETTTAPSPAPAQVAPTAAAPAATVKNAPQTTAAKKPVAATAAKKVAVTTAVKKPVTTTAAKKPVATSPTKPVATTAKPKPPVTTAPKPAPAPPPAAASYTPAQVEQIIRQVWPDDLEDHALAIAQRESKLVPTSRNYCCYGLFAIYYEAGKRLLNSIGVTSADQLLDPWINTRAAVAIYQAAGWTPWNL